MATTEERNINLNFHTNATETKKAVDNLNTSIQKVEDSTQSYTKSLQNNGNAVLQNGGAMGLLNDLTGGYAMMVKDAVEALELFTVAKKADTVATEGATVATTSWTAALLANPVVLITAGVVALGAAIYGLSKLLITNTDYTQKNAEAQAKLTAAYAKQGQQLKINQSYREKEFENQVKIWEAQGKSTQFIKQQTEAYNNLSVATAKQRQIEALADLQRQQEYVRQLYRIGKASDEMLEGANKETKVLRDNLNITTELYREAFQKREDDRVDFQAKEIKESVAHQKKLDDDANKTKEQNAQKEKESKAAALKDIQDFRVLNANAEIQNAVDLQNQQVDILNAGIDAENKAVDDKAKASDEYYAGEATKAIENGKTEKELADKKAQIQADALNQGAATLGQLSEMLGEQTAAGKAAAIAETTINTYKSATSAYSALAGIPIVGPGLGAAAAAVAVAAGLINVKKILSVKTAKDKGSGGVQVPSGGRVSAPATTAPTTSFVSSRDNQLASVISRTINNQPVKAFVVSKDVTTAQELDRNAVQTSSIG